MTEGLRNILDEVEYWHTTEVIPAIPLHQFLGMTWKEYQKWALGTMSEWELAEFGLYEGT